MWKILQYNPQFEKKCADVYIYLCHLVISIFGRISPGGPPPILRISAILRPVTRLSFPASPRPPENVKSPGGGQPYSTQFIQLDWVECLDWN